MVQTFGMNGVTFTGLVANSAGIIVMGVSLGLQLKKWAAKCASKGIKEEIDSESSEKEEHSFKGSAH